MDLALHANATTTPKTRSYIQHSKKAVAELVDELGVSETTIRRWRGRTTVGDRSHRPKRLTTNLSAMEETLVCELRTALQLPLDDIVEVMRRCVNGKLSRSAIHRCLQRHGISRRKKPDRPSVGVFEQATVGFIHFDLKHLPALERRKSYAFVAIDRATRYVYVEIHQRRDAKTSAGFLKRFLAHFPHRVHTILTDNGAEFTDRFAVDMKNKPPGRPSGNHPFDLVCANHKIDHRLTRPYRPQTNGLVERFNRRITEAIGREPKRGSARRTFPCHADRDAFLNRFVAAYNRTRLKCLGYLAPLEALANLPGPNTFAGTTLVPRPLRKIVSEITINYSAKPLPKTSRSSSQRRRSQTGQRGCCPSSPADARRLTQSSGDYPCRSVLHCCPPPRSPRSLSPPPLLRRCTRRKRP
jgi:transposase-like protein